MHRRLLATVSFLLLAGLATPGLSDGIGTASGRDAVVADSCGGRGRFAGLYVGANVGYGNLSTSTQYSETFTSGAGDVGDDRGSLTRNRYDTAGGGHIGYIWQCRSIVLGLEADFDSTNFRSSADVGGFSSVTDAFDQTLSTRIDWFGTIRGRAGLAHENVMAYATAGLAYAHLVTSRTLDVPNSGNFALLNGPISGSLQDSSTVWGWTVGGGLEGLISPHWMIRLEGLYVQLPGSDQSGTLANGQGDSSVLRLHSNTSFALARVGFSYKLGNGWVAEDAGQ